VALTRKFVDSEGIHWQVYELSTDGVAEQNPDDRWLYFFSRDATRSLTRYPDDWAVMDWRGLEGLCRHARPPVQRIPLRRTPIVARVEV
jgi:hypothetical protein